MNISKNIAFTGGTYRLPGLVAAGKDEMSYYRATQSAQKFLVDNGHSMMERASYCKLDGDLLVITPDEASKSDDFSFLTSIMEKVELKQAKESLRAEFQERIKKYFAKDAVTL